MWVPGDRVVTAADLSPPLPVVGEAHLINQMTGPDGWLGLAVTQVEGVPLDCWAPPCCCFHALKGS